MRNRLVAVFSVAAVSALLLSGCAGAAESPDPTSSPSAGSCLLDAQPGAASDAVEVTGSGADLDVRVPGDLEIEDVERTVLRDGDGDDVAANDLVSLRYRIVDATDNTVLDSSDRGEGGELPVLLEPNQASLFLVALECRPLGSQVVLALPGSALGEGSNPVVVYAEATEELPLQATGEPVAPEKDMPAVELADDGTPSITIPNTDAPTQTRVATLKKGDGPTVQSGDLVVVQYKGVKWSDGSEFDSSWSRGAPTQFPTTGVVPGFQAALEGQTVGSQVVVEMPPADAYGTDQYKDHELHDESLVFVVDILATTPAPQQ
ncbi:FKBP-type peptidyl-prolyl cis-trans isomerase [Microbacterium resistens]